METPFVMATDVTGVPYYFDRQGNRWEDIDSPGNGAKMVSPGRLNIIAQDREGFFYTR